ncbi:MAG: hypothetical protein ACM34B_15440 [Nitrospira sp.]
MIVLALLVSGCEGLPFQKRWGGESFLPVMLSWERYQQCLIVSEPIELLQIVDQIEQIMLTGPEPPSWMKSRGRQVKRQPLRTTVDPQALGAACIIRAAKVMAGQDRIFEARALYERVVSRYMQPEWAYYHGQAQEALASLPILDVALIASDPRPISSHTR